MDKKKESNKMASEKMNDANKNESTKKLSEGKKDSEPKNDEEALKKAEEEISELKDKYLRKAAEFENYKKRTLKEKTELILNGSEKAIGSILPILDDLERAVADKTEDPKALKKGLELIYNKFVKTLEGIGVQKIDTDGKDFDVDYHEAVAMVPGMGDDKKGKVIDCVQTGYKLNDKVIRHAKVAVGQ